MDATIGGLDTWYLNRDGTVETSAWLPVMTLRLPQPALGPDVPKRLRGVWESPEAFDPSGAVNRVHWQEYDPLDVEWRWHWELSLNARHRNQVVALARQRGTTAAEILEQTINAALDKLAAQD